MIVLYELVLIFLAEPMIYFVHVPSWYQNGIGVTKSCTNDRGNCCVNELANISHSAHGAVWLSVLPPDLQADLNSDRCGMP